MTILPQHRNFSSGRQLFLRKTLAGHCLNRAVKKKPKVGALGFGDMGYGDLGSIF
jgi:hypothetical protein